MWPVWHLEDPAHFSLPRRSLCCDFLIFFFFLHWMLISLKPVLLKCSSLSPFSSHSDKSILCSCFVRQDFPCLCLSFRQHYFLLECWFKGISLDGFDGAFTKAVPSLEGALTVFPPWLGENCWGFQGNSEFPNCCFFFFLWLALQRRPLTPAAAAGLIWWSNLMATGEELDLPAQGSSVYLERKNKMDDWELHLFCYITGSGLV